MAKWLGLCQPHGRLPGWSHGGPGFGLWPGPALVVAVISGVNLHMEALSLLLPLSFFSVLLPPSETLPFK